NSFGIFLDPVGVLPGWHQQEVAVGEYDCEQIVEVMSYTAGEAADRLHFLRLKELLFQPSPFSNVKHITFDLDEFARGVKDANGILDNVQRRAILAPEFGFEAFEPAALCDPGKQFLTEFRARVEGSRITFQGLINGAKAEHAGKGLIAGNKL